jgi:hypothetical protein
MDTPRARAPSSAEAAGAGAPWSPSLGLLAVAVGAVAGGLAWWWVSQPEPPAESAPTTHAAAIPVRTSAPAALLAVASTPGASSAAAPPAAQPAATPRIARNREPGGDTTPDLSDYVNEGEQPTMGQVIDRLHQAGVYTGLGAFSPPGTRPPLQGLAVPDDFVLPEGYVRHYQATDDGQRIEAILMFAPDRQFRDAAGNLVAIPADRVVPPELAPPGLPIRRVAIPAPADRRPGS